ncbi:hypothetical protein PAECIP112173_02305 [Paenibacillus sp. JJ-100]|uniref:phage tail protein n=1 Tax=Paenibacillus sp. JJ-100 TaxID=2974896 RepID=UPI0022FF8E43|nr:phage tail protein [Paenibacillus sp. JJ-100]CAI6073911.1 hypothetical protein PAECIP112173_02305 [Paenibacillus sp. JJ-100]
MYNKQEWKDEIPDLTRPIMDSGTGKQKTDPQTGRPLFELVQVGTRITSTRLNNMESGIEAAHTLIEQLAKELGGNFVVPVDGIMGLLCTAQGLEVTWTAGIAYVGGRRYQVPAGEMQLNPTQGQYLYVDIDGVVKKTTSQATAKAGLPLLYVATDTSGVISTTDQRVNVSLEEILKRLDNVQIPNASLTTTGITKLNNATTSLSETEAATPKAVNDARKAAMDASVPRTGGVNMTGRMIIGNWGTFSSNSNGSVLYGNNCFLHPTDGTMRFENSHSNMGARGIYMTFTNNEKNKIYVFDTGQIPTVSNGVFNPVFHRVLSTDDIIFPFENPTSNLISNSSGLLGLDGWTNNGGVPFATSVNGDVTSFFFAQNVARNQYAVLDSNVIQTTPGAKYHLQSLFHTSGSYTDTGVLIEVKDYDSGNTLFNLSANTQSWWHRKRILFTIPTGTTRFFLRLVVTNAPPVEVMAFSRIQLNAANNGEKDVPFAYTGEMAMIGQQLKDLKQSGVSAKQLLVDAINANGGSASTSDTWAVLAQKVQTVSSIKPGDYLLYRDPNSIGGTSSTTWRKVKSYTPNIGGTYRIDYTIAVDYSIAGAGGYARLYVNDVPVGVERHIPDNGTRAFSDDITLKTGDVLQLYMRSTTSQNNVYATGLAFKIAFGMTVY